MKKKKITTKKRRPCGLSFFMGNIAPAKRRRAIDCAVQGKPWTAREKSPNEEKTALTGFYLSAKAFPLRALS